MYNHHKIEQRYENNRNLHEIKKYLEKCFGLDEKGRERHKQLSGLDGLTLGEMTGFGFIAIVCLDLLSKRDLCA